MTAPANEANPRPAWFVGAAYGGTDDQTARFLQNGIWENGWDDRYLDEVRSIRSGDRIAIKSTYVRKNGLPFDSREHFVSVMAIKATGTVTANPGDGRIVQVDWTPVDPPREWYFYTYRNTVWQVSPGNWMADGLISFAFDNRAQDLARFRNEPYWRDRYGDIDEADRRFAWTRFYQSIADALLQYRANRAPLVAALHEIASRRPELPFTLAYQSSPLQNIDPFTTMGIFNRSLTDANRHAIATELAEFLQVAEPLPALSINEDGIPLLNNQNSWFFAFINNQMDRDIETLWQVFADALALADGETDDMSAFIRSYDAAQSQQYVAYNLTMGLYWMRPWHYPTLDGNSRNYLAGRLAIKLPNRVPSGAEYNAMAALLSERFREPDFPVHSFPELSWAAYQPQATQPPHIPSRTVPIEPKPAVEPEVMPPPQPSPYTTADIISDGCFLERPQLETMLQRLHAKRNLILQGPPGTGKTWLAKRLAYALVGSKDDNRVRPLQFHPTMSYEDFVRGWRPAGDGRLELVDGPFLRLINDARQDPDALYVMVIEEINRGSPAQIFGEMLTLLEADKRHPEEALALAHPDPGVPDERVYIPPNVYVIGTMNVADRSLALVDFALRRRFAFFDLEPVFGAVWRNWVSANCGIPADFLSIVERKLAELNDQIAADPTLGKQFRIGHSLVTPPPGAPIDHPEEWFQQVVATEIAPLLDEYWFDSPETANNAKSQLMDDR